MGTLVVALLFVALWLGTGMALALSMACVIGAAPTLSLIGVIFSAAWMNPRASIVPTTPTPVGGEEFDCEVTIVTRRVTRTRIAIRVTASDAAGKRLHHAQFLHRGRSRLTLSAQALGRGPFTLGPIRLRWTDPLGLACASWHLPARAHLLALPALLPAQMLPDEAELTRLLTHMSDQAEAPTSVREYRRGDPVRSIHWKQSARHDQLLVKVADSPRRPHHVFALDVSASSWARAEDFEAGVSLVATLLSQVPPDRAELRFATSSANQQFVQALGMGREGGEGPERREGFKGRAGLERLKGREHAVGGGLTIHAGRGADGAFVSLSGERGAMMRALALVELVDAPAVWGDGRDFGPTTVVTGQNMDDMAALARASQRAVLWRVGAEATQTVEVPAGWRIRHLQAVDP